MYKNPVFYSAVVLVSAKRDKSTMEELISNAIDFLKSHNIKVMIFVDFQENLPQLLIRIIQ